jgi:hypothetical protein
MFPAFGAIHSIPCNPTRHKAWTETRVETYMGAGGAFPYLEVGNSAHRGDIRGVVLVRVGPCQAAPATPLAFRPETGKILNT